MMTEGDLDSFIRLSTKRAAILDRLKAALVKGDYKEMLESASALCGLRRPKAAAKVGGDKFILLWADDRQPLYKNNKNNNDHDHVNKTIERIQDFIDTAEGDRNS